MKKKSKRKSSPIWPYLGILACLFLLSLTAPRAWERRARRETKLPEREVAERISPIAPLAATLPELPVSLEAADAEELTARESQLDIIPPVEEPLPSSTLPELEPIIPPAPEYAEDIQLEPLEVATLPAAPAVDPLGVPEAALLELDTPLPPTVPQEEVLEPLPLPAEVASPLPAAEEPIAEEPAPEEPALEEPALEEPVGSATATDENTEEEEFRPLWPVPRALVAQLDELVDADRSLDWSVRARELVEDICRLADDVERQHSIAALRELVKRDTMAPVSDTKLESRILRVRYGLTRWLDIWQAASVLRSAPTDPQVQPVSLERMRLRRAEFERLANGNPAADAWRAYLRLDELTDEACSEQRRRDLAQAVLERFDSPRLTAEQRQFLNGNELRRLREDLQSWAAEPVAVDELLAHLEQFEHSGLASDAARVASDFQSIRWSHGDEAAALGRHLDTHYRNANLRVAVSGELAQRFIPQPGRIDAPVRDMVVNVPVRGYSSTFTKLSLILVPDSRRIRLGLEAQGVVDARTVSSAGPATFRNRGQSTFLVRKLFVLGPRGLHVWPAIAEAENNYNYLVSLETDYDGVPIVGSLIRNIARGQHDEIRSEALRQTEQKVAIKALNQFDSEVQARLDEAEQKMKQGQLAAIRRLGMEVTPISLSTTEQRMVGRLRLAAPGQLGAHTARPRAPSDSWLSLQLHESVLNNTLESLDLEGRSFELESLFAWLGQKLGRPEMAQQEELPENVKVTFAEKDAIRVRAVDDRIEITFSLAELTHEGSRWRNFEVRTSYAPQADGMSPRFARVDTIHLDGQSLRGRIEFKLRAIFSKVLSKNRELKLLPDTLVSDTQFRDLQVSQFVVEDGWIALAYSPRRTAPNMARRPR